MTTRIADLPENITIQNAASNQRSASYAPIDVHPNPYGHPPPSVPNIPTPSYAPPPQYKLPERDIPMVDMRQDEQVQANYIPPAIKTVDYMKQYEEATEKKVREHVQEKQKQSRIDFLIEQGQIPVLVAVLFYIFQMPIFSRLVLIPLSFLGLYDTDGNLNTYGVLLKSSLFGLCFFLVTHSIHFLSEV
jgi:hypothetical protein